MKFFSKQGDEIELQNDSLLSKSSIVGPCINTSILMMMGLFLLNLSHLKEFNHALITFQKLEKYERSQAWIGSRNYSCN